MEVPEISRFLGSLIRMYYREHPVTAPHVRPGGSSAHPSTGV